jgi:hypothetical protein
MSPKTLEDHVGIEIECIVNGTEDDLDTKLAHAGLRRFVEVGHDYSIKTQQSRSVRIKLDEARRTVEDYMTTFDERIKAKKYIRQHSITPVEIRVLCKMSDLKDILKMLAKVLESVDARVNKTCGLHVHLDMRMHSVAACAYRLLKKHKMLQSKVDPQRLKSKYCRPLTEKDLSNFLVSNYLTSRYKDINLLATRDHRTIEVRLHEGTVDTNRILAWCNLLYRVAHTPVRLERNKSIQSIIAS